MPEVIAEIVTAPIVAPVVATRAAINAQIRTIAKTAGLDATWIDEQVDSERSIDEVNAAALAAMTARSTAANVRSVHNEASLDNPAVRVRAAGEALYARSNPGTTLSEPARQFVGMGTVDHARAALVNAGQSIAGLSPATIIERALHTTSDFPLLLGDSVGRSLRQAYEATPSGLKQIGRQTTARDFKDKYKLQLSEAPRLEKVNEAGEFKAGTFSEEKQSYRLATFGKIFNISRQALINDDLGAFVGLARRMGQAAAVTEAQLLVDMFLANSGRGPLMGDGKAMFHIDHKNINTASAFAVAPISIMRSKMRKSAGISGELVNISPKYLIVPAELETTAEQLLATQYYPQAATQTTPESVKKLEIVVEPRLVSPTGYYLAADPSTVDGLEYAYLEGEEGVQIETKAGWEVDGVSIKARLDFGASFLDFRSFQLNEGV